MYEETLAVLRQSPPDRIGHGTFLHRYDPGQGYEEIEDTVISKRIPIGNDQLFFVVFLFELNGSFILVFYP